MDISVTQVHQKMGTVQDDKQKTKLPLTTSNKQEWNQGKAINDAADYYHMTSFSLKEALISILVSHSFISPHAQ